MVTGLVEARDEECGGPEGREREMEGKSVSSDFEHQAVLTGAAVRGRAGAGSSGRGCRQARVPEPIFGQARSEARTLPRVFP